MSMPETFETLEVGHFQKLGSGSYSTVHICELKDGSRVAMKRPGPSILEYMHTTLREGLLLRQGYGPAYKGIFTENDGTFFGISMDLGICTLSKMREQIELRPQHILKVAFDVIQDIYKLHSANLVHGDIKLANVIIFKDFAKICDFGLSSWSSNTGPSPYTSKDEIFTVNYRAPELLDSIDTIETSADIWAFGITLFGAITSNTICTYSDKQEIKAFIEKTFPDDFEKRLSNIQTIIHTTLKPSDTESNFVSHLSILIARCLSSASERPSAKDIYNSLLDMPKTPFVIEYKNSSPSKTYHIECIQVIPKPIQILEFSEFAEETIKLNAKKLLALIKIENTVIDSSILKLSQTLTATMPSWRIHICATLATSLCVMLVRPTHVLQPLWCARFMNTSIRDYEKKLGIALTIAISYPDWSREIWAQSVL